MSLKMRYGIKVHVLKIVLFLCLICIGNSTAPLRIKVGVILKDKMSFDEPFDLPRIKPALDLAFEKIRIEFDFEFEAFLWSYNDGCPWKPLGIMSEMYHNRHIQALIGPTCSEGVESCTRLAQYFRLPMVTGLGDLSLRHYPSDTMTTLTKLSYNLKKISVPVSAVLYEYGWQYTAVLYDTRNALWDEMGSYLVEDLGQTPNLERSYDIPFDSLKITNFTGLLLEAKDNARVFVILCDAELLRHILYQAYQLGMAEGDFVFITIEPFPNHHMGYYREFIRNDDKDVGVTKAYESVLILTLTQPDNTDENFKGFADEVKRRSKIEFRYGFKPDEPVNYAVTAFYDSVMYLAHAYNQTLHEGRNITDGLAVAQKLWNSSFEGIAGRVAIDEYGDREADFDILDMTSPETREFQTVGRYIGAEHRYTPVSNVSIVWHTETQPCGLKYSLCAGRSQEVDGSVGVAEDNGFVAEAEDNGSVGVAEDDGSVAEAEENGSVGIAEHDGSVGVAELTAGVAVEGSIAEAENESTRVLPLVISGVEYVCRVKNSE